MKNVLVTLNSGLGANLGTGFTLTVDSGTMTPTGATRTELLAGVLTTVDDTATTITVTSLGTCTNSLELTITEITTTTTTAPPA